MNAPQACCQYLLIGRTHLSSQHPRSKVKQWPLQQQKPQRTVLSSVWHTLGAARERTRIDTSIITRHSKVKSARQGFLCDNVKFTLRYTKKCTSQQFERGNTIRTTWYDRCSLIYTWKERHEERTVTGLPTAARSVCTLDHHTISTTSSFRSTVVYEKLRCFRKPLRFP